MGKLPDLLTDLLTRLLGLDLIAEHDKLIDAIAYLANHLSF
jgi:hypothetical protein